MRRKVRKIFFAWNYEKEEKWLNSMSAKGLALVAVSFGSYTFEDTGPGDYTVRLELLEYRPGHAESQKYLEFIEETGAEYIGNVSRWVYFRKKTGASGGESFRLFSDKTSLIRQNASLALIFGILSIAQIFSAIAQFGNYFTSRIDAYLVIGIVNILVFMPLIYGFISVGLASRRIKKEQKLFED